jgi:hypothetical protein
MAFQVAVHAPVFPGCAHELRTVIAGLPTGAASPFAAIAGTHYARLVVAEGVRGGTVLVCSAVTDAPEEEFLVGLLTRTADLPDRVWSLCPGWPGQVDVPRAAAWLKQHVVRPTLAFCTHDAPLDRVQEALALRARLIAFAPRAQDLAPADLQAAFLQEFGP